MVHQSLFILGRQPTIGRAELESLFGAQHLEPLGEIAALSDVPLSQINFARLGGSIRLAQPLEELNTSKWEEVHQHLVENVPRYLDHLPKPGTDGTKIKLGISVFGWGVKPTLLLRTGLEFKKQCRRVGYSARVVPNSEAALNSAQVLHNQLTGELGLELLCIRHGPRVYVARTMAAQDIEAYAQRDRERPKRDAFVGMLPPKLAQIIVNLGTGPLETSSEHVILDPFCGTGVILQEALLMGYGAYGSDLEQRMVDYSRQNLEWLNTYAADRRAATSTSHESVTNNSLRYTKGSTPTDIGSITVETGDATVHWWNLTFNLVASETYLGRPLSSWPSPEKLRDIMSSCNAIIQKFLVNIARQIPSGTRLSLAIPAWQSPQGRLHRLLLLDQLGVLGYNRVSFAWSREQEMIYSRPGQLVARELLVITRK